MIFELKEAKERTMSMVLLCLPKHKYELLQLLILFFSSLVFMLFLCISEYGCGKFLGRGVCGGLGVCVYVCVCGWVCVCMCGMFVEWSCGCVCVCGV